MLRATSSCKFSSSKIGICLILCLSLASCHSSFYILERYSLLSEQTSYSQLTKEWFNLRTILSVVTYRRISNLSSLLTATEDELGSSKLSATLPTAPTELSQYPKLCELRRKFPVLYRVEFQVRPGKTHFFIYSTNLGHFSIPFSDALFRFDNFRRFIIILHFNTLSRLLVTSRSNNNLLHFTIPFPNLTIMRTIMFQEETRVVKIVFTSIVQLLQMPIGAARALGYNKPE